MTKRIVGFAMLILVLFLTIILSGKIKAFVNIPSIILVVFGSLGVVMTSNCSKGSEEKFIIAAESSLKLGFIGALILLVSLLECFNEPLAFMLDLSKVFLVLLYGVVLNLFFRVLAQSKAKIND